MIMFAAPTAMNECGGITAMAFVPRPRTTLAGHTIMFAATTAMNDGGGISKRLEAK